MKNLIKSEVAEKVALNFSPKNIELETPAVAKDYIDRKKKNNDFRMSDVIKIQTGVNKIESDTTDQEIENRVLERLKSVQETAYKEAYQLGLEEGRQEAFKAHSDAINDKLVKFEKLVESISLMKKELFQYNEAHIVKLALHVASRLAGAEIKANPEIIKEILKSAIDVSQSEENLNVTVSQSAFDFLEELKKRSGREFEFLKKMKFEIDPQMSDGGCVIRTNYGEIDARFEQRVNKLWEVFSESLYKIKDTISAA